MSDEPRTWDVRLWVEASDWREAWELVEPFLADVRELAEMHPGVDVRWRAQPKRHIPDLRECSRGALPVGDHVLDHRVVELEEARVLRRVVRCDQPVLDVQRLDPVGPAFEIVTRRTDR